MKKFYLTTPLYYVNDVPHIGHAYTTIAADILARWKKMNRFEVFFLTGTDEHGAKIAEASLKTSEPTQDYVNRIAGEFKRLWNVLSIEPSDFIQTTQERHKKVVQQVFEKLKATGDIYKGVYEDWYCIHDESYFSESELVDKKCPSCGRDVQKLKEESYFFKLSKYQDRLLEFYSKNPEFLSPKNRGNEILNFVKSGLNDLSVSRTRVKWGVPIISDPEHTVYVWFDALLNYISALGYDVNFPEKSNDLYKSYWPCDVHLVGKEIFRFHTVIWPAMLMALGIECPKKVFAHGWWTVEGTKMSKSLGNVVDPHVMAAEYGVDAFRYFLFREVPFGSDGDFSEKSLLGRFNSELANNLGNLLQRTTTILLKNFNGEIPSKSSFISSLIPNPKEFFNQMEKSYNSLALGDALEQLYTLMVQTNKFIDEQAPWKLTKDDAQLSTILVECLSIVKALAVFLSPFMPTKSQEIWQRIGEKGNIQQEGKSFIDQFQNGIFPAFPQGQSVIKADPLFMRKGGRWK